MALRADWCCVSCSLLLRRRASAFYLHLLIKAGHQKWVGCLPQMPLVRCVRSMYGWARTSLVRPSRQICRSPMPIDSFLMQARKSPELMRQREDHMIIRYRHMRPDYYVLKKVSVESLKYKPWYGEKAEIPATSYFNEQAITQNSQHSHGILSAAHWPLQTGGFAVGSPHDSTNSSRR